MSDSPEHTATEDDCIQSHKTVMARLDAILLQLEYLRTEVCHMKERLEGTLGMPGIYIRLDRLEQAEDRRRYWTRMALGAAVAAIIGNGIVIVGMVVNLVNSHK